MNYYDHRANGWLSDDERDEDADGLTNYDETHGRLTPGYWASCYSDGEALRLPYAGTRVDDADSDGDGVLDGADDQDHDDMPNIMELSRFAASGHDRLAGRQPVPRRGRHRVRPDRPQRRRQAGQPELDPPGRLRPREPVQPLPAGDELAHLHPAPGFSGSAAPFDDSPNWLSLQ